MRKPMVWFVGSLSLIITICACEEDGTGAPGTGSGPPQVYEYELVEAFPNLTFINPVDLQDPGDGSRRLFVVEQTGVIKTFANVDTVESAATFLDLSSRVTFNGERGMLGLAFHPDYEQNGYFFVYYSPQGANVTRLSRFSVSASDSNAADGGSEAVLLEIPQQFPNHNGGQIAFGPDGYLYVAVGDEGGSGDPNDNAQDLTTLHGSILRIDVDSNDLGEYGIPDDNPFAVSADNYKPEIYAYGLRNPWRFSFDPVTGELWAGDVGQNTWEEIDIVEKGKNYGWDCREGSHDYNAAEQSAACDTVAGLVDPIWEYGRTNGDRSITGGHVYRGSKLTSLVGVYIYADYVSGRIWGLHTGGSDHVDNIELADAEFRISSFGVDGQGELFLCQYSGTGRIFELREKAVEP
jgi:glucose/arabinose dehydrogenase